MARTYYRDFRDGEQHRFTSDLIKGQVPEFLEIEGPLLVSMLQEYYNFLHTGGNPESGAKNVIKLNDVDEVGDYYQQFLRDTGGQYTSANTQWVAAGQTFIDGIYDLWRDQYLLNFPKDTQSFTLFIKRIIEVYRAKGSNQGFEALMRGIYGAEAETKLPYDVTFKPSDGVWKYDEYLQCVYNKDIEKWAGLKIYGRSSEASAYVQRINKKLVNGKLIGQIVISDKSSKQFEHNEVLYAPEYPDVEVRSIAGISSIVLTANGSEFTPGEIIRIQGNGIEGRVVITDSESFAGRLSFTLIDGGSGYRANSIVSITGGVGGSGGNFVIGGIKAPFISITQCEDQIGILAANSQIQIGEANNFITNAYSLPASFYANAPIAGPNSSNGLNISWSSGSNTATLDADVANNTFVNGSIWYLGNTTPGPGGNHTPDGGLVVHDYDPGSYTITFKSQTTAAASTNTAVIRAYAANTVYNASANLYQANVSNTIVASMNYDTFTTGAIDFIVTTDTGRNYVVAPTAEIFDYDVYSLRIPNGAGGYRGNDANVRVGLLANNVIVNLKVIDHGFGYTNAEAVIIPATKIKGTDARGILRLGGVARNEGGWVDTKGFSSSNQKIHDSKRYQAFSYEIVTSESFDSYSKTLKSITHPAGTRMFGRYQTVQGMADSFGNSNINTVTQLEVSVDGGGIEVSNGSSTILGYNTTWTSGSANVNVSDIITTNGLKFVANTISSNTSITANGFVSYGIANSRVFSTSPYSANVILTGTIYLANGNANLVGSSTLFDNQVRSGYGIYLSNGTNIGTVATVQGHTGLTLFTVYTGDTLRGVSNVYVTHPHNVVLTGNVSLSNGGFVITGAATKFTDQVKVNDILVSSANVRIGTVNAVPSNTQIRLANTYNGQTLNSVSGVRIISNRSIMQPFELSGEITIVDGSHNLVGQYTRFENELVKGDHLYLQSNGIHIGMINSVNSNTSANLIQTYTSPNGTDLNDSVLIRRHKISKLLVDEE